MSGPVIAFTECDHGVCEGIKRVSAPAQREDTRRCTSSYVNFAVQTGSRYNLGVRYYLAASHGSGGPPDAWIILFCWPIEGKFALEWSGIHALRIDAAEASLPCQSKSTVVSSRWNGWVDNGWRTRCETQQHNWRNAVLAITLVESPNIRSIGVGEGTLAVRCAILARLGRFSRAEF